MDGLLRARMAPDQERSRRTAPSAGVREELPYAVMVDDLYKRFGRWSDHYVLKGLNFSVRAGEIAALLGKNGSGKTTTLKCLCGLIAPTRGAVRVRGRDVSRAPQQAASEVAAVLEGSRNVYWRLTPRENLEFFAGLHGVPFSRARAHVQGILETLEFGRQADVVTQRLSRGMQQRLCVAACLIRDASVTVLDEPTLGLDPHSWALIKSAIRRLADEMGRAVVIGTHDLSLVRELCDRVILLHDGVIAFDRTVSEALQEFEVQEYELRLRGHLDAETQEQCSRAFGAVMRTSGDSTLLVAQVKDLKDLSGMLCLLTRGKVELVSISNIERSLGRLYNRSVRLAQ
jgi:ABC-2 type transport system ATP-binding protein